MATLEYSWMGWRKGVQEVDQLAAAVRGINNDITSMYTPYIVINNDITSNVHSL